MLGEQQQPSCSSDNNNNLNVQQQQIVDKSLNKQLIVHASTPEESNFK
jgi:hypothetical protein